MMNYIKNIVKCIFENRKKIIEKKEYKKNLKKKNRKG